MALTLRPTTLVTSFLSILIVVLWSYVTTCDMSRHWGWNDVSICILHSSYVESTNLFSFIWILNLYKLRNTLKLACKRLEKRKTKVSGCCGTCVCASILMTTNSLDYPDQVSVLNLIVTVQYKLTGWRSLNGNGQEMKMQPWIPQLLSGLAAFW